MAWLVWPFHAWNSYKLFLNNNSALMLKLQVDCHDVSVTVSCHLFTIELRKKNGKSLIKNRIAALLFFCLESSLKVQDNCIPRSFCLLHTEKSFWNIVKWNQNQIVYTIFPSIWNETDVRLVPNQSVRGKYNLISGWFNKIPKKILSV